MLIHVIPALREASLIAQHRASMVWGRCLSPHQGTAPEHLLDNSHHNVPVTLPGGLCAWTDSQYSCLSAWNWVRGGTLGVGGIQPREEKKTSWVQLNLRGVELPRKVSSQLLSSGVYPKRASWSRWWQGGRSRTLLYIISDKYLHKSTHNRTHLFLSGKEATLPLNSHPRSKMLPMWLGSVRT